MINGDMSLNCREASSKDASLLASIIRRSFLDVARKFHLSEENAPTHPSNCTSDWITSSLDKGIKYYILCENDTPLGCVALEKAGENVCYLERLGVLPEFRRQGYGGRLLEIAFEEARKMGIKRVEIGIIAENTELKIWYESKGFTLNYVNKFDHLPFKVAFMYINIG